MDGSLSKQMRALSAKRFSALEKLVAPARAAANQMKDAGMMQGAAPLAEALFKLDAAGQEMSDLIEADPRAALNAIIEGMSNGDRS
jgi:hypothetical protein